MDVYSGTIHPIRIKEARRKKKKEKDEEALEWPSLSSSSSYSPDPISTVHLLSFFSFSPFQKILKFYFSPVRISDSSIFVRQFPLDSFPPFFFVGWAYLSRYALE
jgi:hypothetical protein